VTVILRKPSPSPKRTTYHDVNTRKNIQDAQEESPHEEGFSINSLTIPNESQISTGDILLERIECYILRIRVLGRAHREHQEASKHNTTRIYSTRHRKKSAHNDGETGVHLCLAEQ